jgi:ornithine carbamoyltransferase
MILGFRLTIATPPGYAPNKEYTTKAKNTELTDDPKQAIADADIIYTDVWTSMGQENEATKRTQIFMPFQINDELLKSASKDYLIMHCLPAHRGEEITDEVIDGNHSIILDQAENRLHAQKGIMVWLSQNS